MSRPTWLMVLPICLGLLGVLAILGNLVLLLVRMVGDHPIPWHEVPWNFAIWEIELRFVAGIVGMLLIAAAVKFLRSLSQNGWIILGLAITLAAVNPPINRDATRHFAGNSFAIGGPPGEFTVITDSQSTASPPPAKLITPSDQ